MNDAPAAERETERASDYRERLLEGFALASTQKGYAATTIADIVRAAKVSKRTFYEHFSDKRACFLAVYESESRKVLGLVQEAAVAETEWQAQLEVALRTYIETLASNPALTRTCLLEIHAAGADGLALRRTILEEFAESLRVFVESARLQNAELKALTPSMAMAVAGGINELLLLNVERGRTLRGSDLARTAYDLVRAVLLSELEEERS